MVMNMESFIIFKSTLDLSDDIPQLDYMESPFYPNEDAICDNRDVDLIPTYVHP